MAPATAPSSDRMPRAPPRSGRALSPVGRSRPAHPRPARARSTGQSVRRAPRATRDRPIRSLAAHSAQRSCDPARRRWRAAAATATTAAHPVRRPHPAPPPRLRLAMAAGGAPRDRATQCRAPRRRRATRRPHRPRDRQPSRARFRRACWAAKCPFDLATTPATGPVAVSTRTCCASNCWSHNGCRDPGPIRWSRR